MGKNNFSIGKIAKATHNVVAYRFIDAKNILNADYDDDGETSAGGRLLHLLELIKVQNVLVVVSRWFGGVLLGADRSAASSDDLCGCFCMWHMLGLNTSTRVREMFWSKPTS